MNKKFLFVFILGIFLLSFASATLLDYNENTRTAEFSNNFLFINTGKIATAQLITPLDFKVGLGEQYVWEQRIEGFDSYQDFISEMEFYDKKNGMAKINRDYDLRKKEIVQVEVNDYECVESLSLNGTIENDCFVSGSHLEDREIWTTLKQVDFKKNDVLFVRMYTFVEEGDKVEWIPTMAGKKVYQWATWTADLNIGLRSYWKFDGNLIDSLGINNGTDSGTSNTSGIIGSARSFDGSDYINMGNLQGTDRWYNFTFNTWLIQDGTNGGKILGKYYDGSLRSYDLYAVDSGTCGGKMLFEASFNGDNSANLYCGGTIGTGSYHMVTLTYGDPDLGFWIDGINVANHTIAGGLDYNTADLLMGSSYTGSSGFITGSMDETMISLREFSGEEIVQLYNGGSGITWTDDFNLAPNVTAISPENNTIYSTAPIDVNFTCYGSDDINFTSMEFNLNGSLTQTNSSGINNTNYIFTETLNDGDYNWSCIGNDDEAEQTESEIRFLTIDTTPFIEFLTPPTLENYANITQEYIPMKINTTTTQFENISFDLYAPNGTVLTQFYTTEVYDINFTNQPDGHYHYNVTICATSGKCNSTETRHLNHDVTPPEINISSPLDSYNYIYVGQEFDLNFTAIDRSQNISSCSWDYNGTNYSIACLNATLTSANFLQEEGNYNVTVHVNDTFGNLNSSTKTWAYKIIETNRIFNNETTEGDYETFALYLTKDPSVDVTNVVLHYNGQTDTSSLFSSGNDVVAMSELFISNVVADINKTLYFTVTLDDATTFNTTSSIQLVRNLEIDDCSSQPNQFITLNLLDEEEQTPLSGDIDVFMSVVNPTNYQEILNFTGNYSSVNTKSFCSNLLLNETEFLLTGEIRYDSTNHSAEFYNIQRSELSNYPKNYSLYDLKDDDTTKFKIIYQGEDLVGVEGAIVQLQRKYISEGIYKIVEAPLTSSDSTAIVHIDTNTNLYKAIIVKNGVVLNTFENLAFICQSELTGECTLNLIDYLVPPNSVSIESIQDFSYTITSSLENKTITMTYTVPSGTTSTIKVIANQTDIIGVNEICDTTVSSAGGSIECTYNSSIQDSFIKYNIYKDDVLIAQKSYVVQDDLRDDFNGDNYFILIIFTISLIFMATLSPEFIIINSIISIIVGGATWLIRGMDFVLGLGAIAWLLLAGIIIIVKMSKQEDT